MKYKSIYQEGKAYFALTLPHFIWPKLLNDPSAQLNMPADGSRVI